MKALRKKGKEKQRERGKEGAGGKKKEEERGKGGGRKERNEKKGEV
jgi:hypothetical protein